MLFFKRLSVTRQSGKLRYSLIFLVLLVFIFTMVSFLSNGQNREVTPFFIELPKPLVISHRGGSTFPENTLPGFQHSIDIGVDVIEFDVHMTKDGHLVVIHDFTVDRTTDGQGRVDSFTLAEIKELDAGYSYTNTEGLFIFRNQGITIPTVREVFEEFPNNYMNIELKAQSPEIEQVLWDLIESYNMQSRVVISSFEQDIMDQFNKIAGGTVAVSGGKREAAKFVFLHKFYLSALYSPRVDTIQLPKKSNGFHLIDQKLIDGAKMHDLQIYYWTINDRDTMERLLLLGVDGIITDDPELLFEVMHQLNIR
ncbi:glycerophosphodiester phosphodiesterase [Anaerobacillus sp. CMMVII]|uniref:glycerophosphodiester phosphodiesterase n=1 Tax=Anaerobacillus sp. CMMVII TaxID=2755588 RepID=UPI0021B82734|nr:glycerophosphodiester phosphodiesterase [Anaerobacillus sp. CMMVII]MCT8137997.1 glycerophosphodiester phosphodiesterase [Anaerobacillus sp. CMMVII]